MHNDSIFELMTNYEKDPEFFIISGVVNTTRWYPNATDLTDGPTKHCVAFQLSTNLFFMLLVLS